MFQLEKFNLDFETSSTCNRACPTCLRNSHPDRDALQSWFESSFLSDSVIFQALDEAAEHPDFSWTTCLSFYNEPLMDKRIAEITQKIKRYYPDMFVYFHTNGDYLHEEIVETLDGVLDRLVVTLYQDEPKKSERATWVHTLFSKTVVDVITQSAHIPTHFSPAYDVKALAEKHVNHTCLEPSRRIVINHRRQFLLCCDDLIGEFDLGTFPEKSIEEHWEEKKKIQSKLSVNGGRKWHPYCVSCPRP